MNVPQTHALTHSGSPGSPEKKARVLVVDDQPTNIQLIYEILRESFDLFMATSGPQALAFCQKTPPDIVLLDVMMPGMDGYEVCQKLKLNEQCADIPVIFITSKNDIESEVRGLEVGGVDFISKPVNRNYSWQFYANYSYLCITRPDGYWRV